MPTTERKEPSLSYILKFILFTLLFLALTLLMSRIFYGVLPHGTKSTALPSGGSTETPHRIVVLDAGHGGEDGGTSSKNGILEKDLNLSLTLLLKDQLTALGVEVVLTRDTDRLLYDPNADYVGRKKLLDQRERLRITEELKEQKNTEVLFVSIHMNSYPEESVRGMQVWYSDNTPDSRALAEALRKSATELLGDLHDRSPAAAGSSIFLLDRLTVPAVLIECGFLSSPEDAALLASDDYRLSLAFAISSAILQFNSDS